MICLSLLVKISVSINISESSGQSSRLGMYMQRFVVGLSIAFIRLTLGN